MLTKTLRELAETAITLVPAVEYVNLTASDQGEYLTVSPEAMTTVTATPPLSWEQLEQIDSNLYADLEYAAGDISWNDAEAATTVPGWEVLDPRGGHYRFHPRQFLKADEAERAEITERYSVTLSWGARTHEAARAQLEALTTAMQHDDVLPVYEDLAWSDIEEVR